jgi:adenylate kinase
MAVFKGRIGFFGLPGAGKGTQAQRLSEEFCIPHISTGDIFRSLQSNDSELARKIRVILASGQLVPDEVVTEITFQRLAHSDCERGFILDGFPRTISQATALQESIYPLDILLEIDVPLEKIIKRLTGRRVCSHCNEVYHIDFLPQGQSFCPKDKALLVQRDDDALEAVTTRLKLFQANFLPIKEFYAVRNIISVIDGDDSPDKVFLKLKKELASRGLCL